MTESSRGGMRRFGQLVRDAWLMFGLVLLILVLIELAYRGQANARSGLKAMRAAGPVRSPYADSLWAPALDREYQETFHEHWKPFVYFRRGFYAGTMINVDSSGHRRTVGNTASGENADTVHLFFFGGSTMWGTNLRDKSTIASVAAQRLVALAPKGVAIDITNYGESGYVFTQELIELELQLRAGNVPDVVLFYDGINDMAAAVQYGAAGVSQNESNRSREFDFGRAISGTETGVGSDLRAAGAIGGAILQRVQFMQRLMAVAAPAARAPKPADWLARDVVRIYVANADIIEALSRAYGFRVLYVWQPALFSTSKKLTPFEQSMFSVAEANPLFQRAREMINTSRPALDSAMKFRVGMRFVDETPSFSGDTISVFSDPIGHTTEKAVVPIVEGFLPALRQLVDSARATRTRAHATAGRGIEAGSSRRP